MSKRYVVPNTESVEKTLGIIFGDDIEVLENSSKELSGKHLARFIDRDDKLVAVSICDKHFVGYSGGALSMVPVGAVDDLLESDELTQSLLDNFYEVMNICSKLMMSDFSDHLRLDNTLLASESSEETINLVKDSTHVGFQLDIPRYGKGLMDFFIV